jgi:hypothetical protein
MALLLCIVIAYEAQTGRRYLEPRWEVGEEEELAEEQQVERRRQWHAQVQVYSDCMAVTHATRRTRAALRDQVKYGDMMS